jgi:hypothetical protein
MNTGQNGLILMLLWIAGAIGIVPGCGNAENDNEEPVRISDECESHEDCSKPQPFCLHGECYPCVSDRDCEDGDACVQRVGPDQSPPVGAPVEEDSIIYRYCSECIPMTDSQQCPDGEVCKKADCNEQTLECEPAECVPEEQTDASP